MIVMKKTDNSKYWQGVAKLEFSSIVGRSVKLHSHFDKTVRGVLQS
jgi:hypothetical protein